jgi:hypothetical protein
MTTNQQEFEKGFNVRMEEVSEFTAVAKAELHELQDFKDITTFMYHVFITSCLSYYIYALDFPSTNI